MNAQEFHHIQNFSSIPRSPLISRLAYDSGGKLIYSGLARRGAATSDAAWLIEICYYDSEDRLTHTLMSDFNQVWDDRASVVYA